MVQVIGSSTSKVSIDTKGFKGKAEIRRDGNRQMLIVVPDPSDSVTDFDVTVDGKHQTARVFPVSTSLEESDVESIATPPDPNSRDYTVVTQSLDQGTFTFNGASHDVLRRIQISGYRVVIETGGSEGLLERLMPGGSVASDVESVEIYARQVVIRAPLHVPGADVKIYAETLEFQDTDATTSLIDTSPLSPTPQTAVMTDGSSGQQAGNVYLSVTRLVNSENDTHTRFRLVGGTGQQGGPFKPNTAGTDLATMPTEPQIGGIVRVVEQHPKKGLRRSPSA